MNIREKEIVLPFQELEDELKNHKAQGKADGFWEAIDLISKLAQGTDESNLQIGEQVSEEQKQQFENVKRWAKQGYEQEKQGEDTSEQNKTEAST